jgi:hypothetical protein
MGDVTELKPPGRKADGKFARGNTVGRHNFRTGRPPGAKLKKAIEGLYAEKPTKLMYQVVLEGLESLLEASLGRKPTLADIPEFEENQQLQIWVFHVYAIHGSTEHAKELLDRISPKPSRVSIDATVLPRPPMGAAGDGSDEAARAFYKRLEGDSAHTG